MGKNIPPPKDRKPSQGNYKEMPEGVMPQAPEEYQQQEMQPMDGQEYMNAQEVQDGEAESYVQELMEKASASVGDEEEEEEEEY